MVSGAPPVIASDASVIARTIFDSVVTSEGYMNGPSLTATDQGFPLAGSFTPSTVMATFLICSNASFGSSSGSSRAIDHQLAAILHRVRRFREAADVIDRERLLAKLRMAAGQPDILQQTAMDLERAGDRVAAVVGAGAVRRHAFHGDEHVDAAAISEADAVAVAAEQAHLGPHAFGLHHVPDRVMASGFARDAAEEHQPAVDRGAAADDRVHGMQHRAPWSPSVRSDPCP